MSTIEYKIGSILRERSWQLAVAESCTGGLISHWVTNVPGASDYFLGGITAYNNSVKVALLDVSLDSLKTHGAVSQAVVEEMADGVRYRLSAAIGLSISGIAGPDGGSAEKPVGLAWIGLSTPTRTQAWNHLASGGRLENKQEFARTALKKLLDYLEAYGKD